MVQAVFTFAAFESNSKLALAARPCDVNNEPPQSDCFVNLLTKNTIFIQFLYFQEDCGSAQKPFIFRQGPRA